MKALPHGNDVAFDKPPDILVLYLEKNSIRLDDADEHKSKINCDSQSNHFLSAFSGHHLKLPFIALERQQSGPRAHSSMLNSYITSFGRNNNHFDQLIATDVMFYFIKTEVFLVHMYLKVWFKTYI